MSKKDKIIADLAARATGWFIKTNIQTTPRHLGPILKKTPVLAKAVQKRYQVDVHDIPSFDGVKINFTRFRTRKGCNWDGKNHVMVMVHGFEGNQVLMWMETPLFLPLGYDCVTMDARTAGVSGGKGIYTLGYNEAKDLGAVVEWVRKEYGEDTVIGIHGVSAGAATCMMYAPTDPNIAFVLEDCGYAALPDTIQEIQGRLMKFVDWDEFYPRVLKYGAVGDVTYDIIKPIDAVAAMDPNLPLMVQHGLSDTYIIPENSNRIYEAKRGIKEIHQYKGAPHASSYFMHPVKYYKDIKAFLGENGLLRK